MIKSTVTATDLKVGMRLDIGGKTRVAQIHPRTDKVLVQTRTRGVRSPSVKSWANTDTVTIYQEETQP